MDEVLFPTGYKNKLVNFEELMKRHRFDLMEPHFAMGLFSWLWSKNGKIGIGGSFRLVQPVRPGFAPPGKSFHQLQKFSDGTEWFMAVDLVHVNEDPNAPHRSPYWSEVPKQGTKNDDILKFRVHCNVNGEPWHMQNFEIDGYDSWVRAGKKRLDTKYEITGYIPDILAGSPPPKPLEYQIGDRLLMLASPTMTGNDVLWVQNAIRKTGLSISIDSYYGYSTMKHVMTVQRWNGLVEDGIVGPKTIEVLKKY